MSTLISYQTPINSLSNWLEDFLPNNLFETSDRHVSVNSWPKVDIAEAEDSFSIQADLPGMEKKDISVTIENNVIRIDGEKAEEHKTEKGKYYHFERNYGKFSRSFALPEGIDTQKISAVMKNGVLELTLPKTPKAQPKAIDIKID